MKIIALLAFKNEEHFLPIYLQSILPIADQIIAIDDGSTDRSRQLIEEKGGDVIANEESVVSGWAEHAIRQKLLQLGRRAGGTHFVCLDADEAFRADFMPQLRNRIAQLKPGQNMMLPWIALW